MVIGITGGIGSGKSTVLKYINENYDVEVLLTDNIAKDLMKPGMISYNLIVEYFGDEILSGEEIDSKKLGKIVFNNKEKLGKLNSFTHPYVFEYIENFISIHSDKIIFIESALLMSTKLKDMCDKILYVETDLEIRKERLMSGREYTLERIEEVLKNQNSEYNEQMNKIVNNTYDEMTKFVDLFMREIE